jgi:hypothetical protein
VLSSNFLRVVTIAAVANKVTFLLIVVGCVLLCGAMITIVIQTKNCAGRWGLNLNSIRGILKGKPLLRKVVCPECGREQKDFRRPTKPTEFLWGGWTCSNCGTSMDKWGKKIRN